MKKYRIYSLILALIIALSVFSSCSREENTPLTGFETCTDATVIPQTTEEPEPYVVKTVRIGSTGDILIHSPIINTASSFSPEHDYNFIFTRIKDTYSRYDYMVANLEVPLGGPEGGAYSGYPLFNLPDTLADALKNAGVDMLLTANNHSLDARANGMIRTAKVLYEKRLNFIGTRFDENTPYYKVVDFDGVKVGMICYTYSTKNGAGTRTLNGNPIGDEYLDNVNIFDYYELDAFKENARLAIESMKNEGADFTVFYMHWGNEYQFVPNSYQKDMANSLCELGADFIIGGHPHVVQPFEMLTSSDGAHNTFCLYSTGNAISNQRKELMDSEPTGHTEDGIIYELAIDVWSDGRIEISDLNLLPTWVNMYYDGGRRMYEIVPLDVSVPDWSGFGCDVNKMKESYNRTMELVGSGLNSARSFLGFEEVLTYIE